MAVIEAIHPTQVGRASLTPAPQSRRYYDLDWLRLFALLFVFLYHSAKPFGFDDWHLKNTQTSGGFDAWLGFLAVWIIPVLFLVSGMSIALSLRERSAKQFLGERLRRLLIPFLLGVFILAPPQVYIERASRGEFTGSLLAFLPHYFDGLYLGYGGPGNFAWHGLHMWYVGLLLVYSLLLLPFFMALRQQTRQRGLARLGAWLQKPGAIFLPAIPLMLLSGGLDPATLGRRDLGEWNVFIYLALIVYGFVLSASTDFPSLARRYRGVALLAALIPGFLAQYFDSATYGSGGFLVGFAARGLLMWCLLILLVGLFYPLRDKNPPFLRHTSEMGMPFYILHQPVILAVDLIILPLDLPPLAKYALIIAICLPLIVGVYECVVRRFNPVRVLFGMRINPSLKQQNTHLLEGADSAYPVVEPGAPGK